MGVALLTLCVATAAQAATLYVSVNSGSDNYSIEEVKNNGKMLKSIGKAMSYASWGDHIVVRAGTYNENLSITSTHSGITFKNYPNERPILKSNASWIWHIVHIVGAQYVTFQGFEIDGDLAHDYADGVLMEGGSHHITILNNVVHSCGGGGISTLNRNATGKGEAGGCDWIKIDDNVIYDNCFESKWDPSAISLHGNSRMGDNNTVHNYVRRNRVFGNIAKYTPPSEFGFNYHTDGNGIIVDIAGPDAPLTLIENNIVYKNGGRGIHILKSSNVEVVNNSLYKNCQDRDITEGELSVVSSSNIKVFNNLAFGIGGSVPVNNISTREGPNFNVVFRFNSYYNGRVTYSNNTETYGDPKYMNPENADRRNANFQCNTGGVGVNTGTTEKYSQYDFAWTQRPQGSQVDRGAYERS